MVWVSSQYIKSFISTAIIKYMYRQTETETQGPLYIITHFCSFVRTLPNHFLRFEPVVSGHPYNFTNLGNPFILLVIWRATTMTKIVIKENHKVYNCIKTFVHINICSLSSWKFFWLYLREQQLHKVKIICKLK